MDRKIVEYLVAGKSHRFIKQHLKVGAGRLEKVKQLAQAHGYLQGRALPEYPETLFPDRLDRRAEQRSDVDRLLMPHQAWIEERLKAGWKPITVFEEIGVALGAPVTRPSFYRFLHRHALARLAQDATAHVVPEIVHQPGEALLLDWGKLCTVRHPVTGATKTLWVLIGVLGFSRYLVARLVWRSDVATTLAAIEAMFAELGGVPARATSDNPKCFCLEASWLRAAP